MLRRIGFPLLCLAMFTIAGGHWLLLQSIAWAQMVHDYSQGGTSLLQAVEMTFSGEKPCEMCMRISKGQKTEKEQPATAEIAKKSDFPLTPASDLLSPPQAREFAFRRTFTIDPGTRADAPPGPIPIYA